MKTVYVDVSLPVSQYKIVTKTGLCSNTGQGIITIVVEENGKTKVIRDVTGNYQKECVTHEAEFLGIISALNNVPGNFEIRPDRQDIVNLLTENAKIRKKTRSYVEKIQKLSQNREIKFVWESRETNKAGLKNDALSFMEINNPKLSKDRLAWREESIKKINRIIGRTKNQKNKNLSKK
ncbi:reverse transcriptase-like protein [Thermoproteota archaeon]